jgi:hypothetical protein
MVGLSFDFCTGVVTVISALSVAGVDGGGVRGAKRSVGEIVAGTSVEGLMKASE